MNDTKKISFCTNTARNEINHTKLLFKSLEKNLSRKDHEIIVFIDSDNQGTFEWLLTQKEIFPNLKILRNESPICYGYARNINEMFEQASHEIVSYLQSDMVICKDYDIEILKGLEPGMMVCSTRVEPPLHPDGPEKITKDFGLDPLTFNLEGWTEFAEQHKEDRWSMYFFAPFTMYKKEWLSVGGHDTIFRRSREDSDMLIRMVLNGTKIMQTWRALAYHFTCTSSRGPKWFDKTNTEAQERLKIQQLADQHELTRFTILWGAFSHGALTPDGYIKQHYYNVAAHMDLEGADVQSTFPIVESFFTKVYVPEESLIQKMQDYYDSFHNSANKLLNISDEVWKEYGYMYNQLKAADRFKTHTDFTPEEDDIVIKFKLKDITNQLLNEFLINLQHIIHESVDEPGAFEYGPFTIIVNRKINRASEKMIVKNPTVKPEHLYTIH
jgi:glycosyltransferase involved in cell wall biosynthesis